MAILHISLSLSQSLSLSHTQTHTYPLPYFHTGLLYCWKSPQVKRVLSYYYFTFLHCFLEFLEDISITFEVTNLKIVQKYVKHVFHSIKPSAFLQSCPLLTKRVNCYRERHVSGKGESFGKGRNVGPVKRAARNGHWGRQPGGMETAKSFDCFFNGKTSYISSSYQDCYIWLCSKYTAKGALLAPPNIQRASFSKVYEGYIKANNCLP